MENTTKDKDEYIKAWNNHANDFLILMWTPDKSISNEVKKIVDDLKIIIQKVANDKFDNKGAKV